MGGVYFGRNFLGVITRPYETYRRLTKEHHWGELVYLGVLVIGYFALASLVKTAAFRPFLLTRQFVVLFGMTVVTVGLTIGLLLSLGKVVGGQGSGKGVLFGWLYTLIPTTVWFLATSILYVLIPPPRSTSAAGIIFSVLYLVFSLSMFFWKLTLGYLTLRFSLKLDLPRILVVAGIAGPIMGLYSLLMYRWGIFKVPFI